MHGAGGAWGNSFGVLGAKREGVVKRADSARVLSSVCGDCRGAANVGKQLDAMGATREDVISGQTVC